MCLSSSEKNDLKFKLSIQYTIHGLNCHVKRAIWVCRDKKNHQFFNTNLYKNACWIDQKRMAALKGHFESKQCLFSVRIFSYRYCVFVLCKEIQTDICWLGDFWEDIKIVLHFHCCRKNTVDFCSILKMWLFNITNKGKGCSYIVFVALKLKNHSMW